MFEFVCFRCQQKNPLPLLAPIFFGRSVRIRLSDSEVRSKLQANDSSMTCDPSMLGVLAWKPIENPCFVLCVLFIHLESFPVFFSLLCCRLRFVDFLKSVGSACILFSLLLPFSEYDSDVPSEDLFTYRIRIRCPRLLAYYADSLTLIADCLSMPVSWATIAPEFVCGFMLPCFFEENRASIFPEKIRSMHFVIPLPIFQVFFFCFSSCSRSF